MMTYNEAYAYIETAGMRGSIYGVETEKELLRRLGNPQDKLAVIHIAGTNGKGSIFAFLDSILEDAGYLVGRYISPVIFTYLERFQIQGTYMTEEAFAAVMEKIIPVCKEMEAEGLPAPTAFEIETAAAFLYFFEKKVDVVLLETGLGGKNDATNVIKKPLCTVLASISRDHMNFLGDTLAEILEEKMGILREQVPCAAYPMQKQLEKQWLDKCDEMNIETFAADESKLEIEREDLTGSVFLYKGQRYALSVPGVYQIYNSITAIEICNILNDFYKERFALENVNIKRGLKRTLWKGRFQKVGEQPLTYIDGAHNQGGWESLRENIKTYFSGRQLIYICGVLADKEYKKMVDILAPYAECVITVTPDNPRALKKEELAACYLPVVKQVESAETVLEAKELAEEYAEKCSAPVILAFGSLSFIGPLINH